MVGRRKQKKWRNPKLAQQINSNLLKISIITDNYIYNNIPITIREAKQMKDELSTYKILIKNDVRILQIIDKQTRLLQGIVREEESICKSIVCEDDNQLNDETDKDLDANVEERSVEIHLNTSVTCSPGTFYPTDTLIGMSSNLVVTDSPTKDSGAIVNTQTRFDNTKTIDNTPETISLPSQDDTNFKKVNVEVSQVIKNSHRSLKNIYYPTNSKRKKNANNLSWLENMKYVRVVEDDEYDPKLSNLGKFWDNFQIPQDWDENDFSYF